MVVYKETANDLHRELSHIEKKPLFCLCARANHALRALITCKILRSKKEMLNARVRNHLISLPTCIRLEAPWKTGQPAPL